MSKIAALISVAKEIRKLTFAVCVMAGPPDTVAWTV